MLTSFQLAVHFGENTNTGVLVAYRYVCIFLYMYSVF